MLNIMFDMHNRFNKLLNMLTKQVIKVMFMLGWIL